MFQKKEGSDFNNTGNVLDQIEAIRKLHQPECSSFSISPRKSSSAPRLSRSIVATKNDILEDPESSSGEEADDINPNNEPFYYFDDDAEDKHYAKDKMKDAHLWCEVCGLTFEDPHQFISHHRRHIAPEIFRCTSCNEGFVNLKSCYHHETMEHKKIPLLGNILTDPPHPPETQPSESSSVNPEVQNDSNARMIPSTCLEPYRGPSLVKSPSDAFYIQQKWGNSRQPVENFPPLTRIKRKRSLINLS